MIFNFTITSGSFALTRTFARIEEPLLQGLFIFTPTTALSLCIRYSSDRNYSENDNDEDANAERRMGKIATRAATDRPPDRSIEACMSAAREHPQSPEHIAHTHSEILLL